jgi:hypothetical protein
MQLRKPENMNERIIALLYKLLIHDELTIGEEDELGIWVEKSPYNRVLFDEVTDFRLMEREFRTLVGCNKKATWSKIRELMAIERQKLN